MKYKVKSNQAFLDIYNWINALDDPLVVVKWKGGIMSGISENYQVTASGSNETILLLKYGHMLEQML